MKKSNQKTNKKLHYKMTERYFKNGTLDRGGYYNSKKKRKIMIWNTSYSILEKILQDDPEITIVIDVGCGTGDFALHLAKQFPQFEKIIGIDFLKEVVNIAKEKEKQSNRVSFLEGDILNIPSEEKSFDVSFCINVLHHIHKEDFENALSELTRITDKYLILDIRDKNNIFNFWFKYIGLPFFYSDLPVYTNSISEVNSIMKNNKFGLQKEWGVIPLKRTGWRVLLVYKRFDA